MNDMKGEGIVVLKALRQDMLYRIHNGHMGMEKCKGRARDILFWAGVNLYIEEAVQVPVPVQCMPKKSDGEH